MRAKLLQENNQQQLSIFYNESTWKVLFPLFNSSLLSPSHFLLITKWQVLFFFIILMLWNICETS